MCAQSVHHGAINDLILTIVFFLLMPKKMDLINSIFIQSNLSFVVSLIFLKYSKMLGCD